GEDRDELGGEADYGFGHSSATILTTVGRRLPSGLVISVFALSTRWPYSLASPIVALTAAAGVSFLRANSRSSNSIRRMSSTVTLWRSACAAFNSPSLAVILPLSSNSFALRLTVASFIWAAS